MSRSFEATTGSPLPGLRMFLRRGHNLAGLSLRFLRERHVDGHLVAVEVGVKRRTDQRVQLDSVAFDKDRLEGLDAEAVEGRCAVKQHVFVFDDVFENRPHLRHAFVDETAGAADVVREFFFKQFADDERAEELERHVLGQTALVEA